MCRFAWFVAAAPAPGRSSLRTKAVLAVVIVAVVVAAILLVARKTVQTSVRETNGSESAAAGPRVPVLVELFTSEGCSSCPPADALLSRLERSQAVPGVEVIALSEHVDYWNRLGWSDPYSSAEFSTRQNEYAGAFKTDDVYTPQMIVDGHTQFVGSNEAEARRAIADSARDKKTAVIVSIVSERERSIVISVRVDSLPGVSKDDSADVMLAITESGLRSNVTRGENSGRVLNHVAVVRKLSPIGELSPIVEIDSQKPVAFTAQPVVELGKTWKRNDLKAIAFIQERSSRRVLGSASLSLAK